MVFQAFSINFLTCVAPYSSSIRNSSISEQLFPPWISASNLTFQHPVHLCNRKHSGMCKGCSTDHVFNFYFVLPSMDHQLCSPLLYCRSFSVPADFPIITVLVCFYWVRELSSFAASCWIAGPFSDSSFLFSFILSGCKGIFFFFFFFVLFGVWSLQLVFRKNSVRTFPFVVAFLMYWWGEMNSTSSFSAILTVIYVSVLSMLSSKNFKVSSLTTRSLIHFEFTFVYGVKESSNFIY